MNILCVIDNLGSGGAQRQLVTLAIELKKQGYGVCFFTYYPQNFFQKELQENNISIYYEGKRGKFGWNVVKKLKEVIKKESIDVGISYMKTPNIYLGFAKLLGAKLKTISSERTRTNFNVQKISNWMRYVFHSKSDKVVFNSFHEKDNWCKNFPSLTGKAITIYNGVDTNRFSPKISSSDGLHKFIGIGTIGPHKNLETILEAIFQLKQRGILIYLDWYGKIVKEDATFVSYATHIEELLVSFDIKDQVHFFSATNEIHVLLKNYSGLVHSSVLEGLPNVACEALASGVPIIISNILDHPILVGENNKRGFLFNPNKSSELEDAFEKFLKLDEKSYQIMRKNAREFALEELSVEKFVDSYKTIIENL